MEYQIITEGFVPKKILKKAQQILQQSFHWRKTRRSRQLLSYKISDCFRLVKKGNSRILLLMDHKHYNRHLTA
ncbi:MAG: hypothetical protein MJZ22_02820 [Candidatus Saccharibacteria bacterium]|nr:hypothetical protein [Candidatus Saccharibacteria bacterium]